MMNHDEAAREIAEAVQESLTPPPFHSDEIVNYAAQTIATKLKELYGEVPADLEAVAREMAMVASRIYSGLPKLTDKEIEHCTREFTAQLNKLFPIPADLEAAVRLLDDVFSIAESWIISELFSVNQETALEEIEPSRLFLARDDIKKIGGGK